MPLGGLVTASEGFGPEGRQLMGGSHETIPVFVNIFGWPTDLGDDFVDLLGGDHFDGIPGADGQLIGIRFFLRNVDTHLAADTSFQINFTPLLDALHDAPIERPHFDTIDGTDFQTRFTTGAVVGVDHRQLLGNLLARTFFAFLF